jgi:AcrR family transcriptional regulator
MDTLAPVPPRPADPNLNERILEIAARLLATEGRDAVSVRRLARELGTSTMAIYTHFGGMDELYRQVRRRGFAQFGAELARGAVTDDPVADWMTQGWGYRRFALRQPHLYAAMFGQALLSLEQISTADLEAGMATFVALLDRMEACVRAGRWDLDDLTTSGEAVWSAVHGHMTIELTGYFDSIGRNPVLSYCEIMMRLSIGFGDDRETAASSLATARRRAMRADRSDGTPASRRGA